MSAVRARQRPPVTQRDHPGDRHYLSAAWSGKSEHEHPKRSAGISGARRIAGGNSSMMFRRKLEVVRGFGKQSVAPYSISLADDPDDHLNLRDIELNDFAWMELAEFDYSSGPPNQFAD